MAEIEIEYCVPCGLLAAIEDADHALLEEFGSINGLRMKPGHGGVWKVSVVDGELISDKAREGFDPAEIVPRVGERMDS